MSSPRKSRPRHYGKPGQVWVEHNYDAKRAAMEENGGELPYSPSLDMTPYPNDDVWSDSQLPEILFYLLVPPSKYAGLKVGYLMEDGKPVLSEEGHHIRDFEILPRRVSLDVPGWLVETWRRLDTRISYRDILDRQVSDPKYGGIGLKKLTKNALQNHCRRDCRKVLNCWVEYGRRAESHRTEVEAIENLSYQNIVNNTSLFPCATAPHRLVKVKLVRHFENGHFCVEPFVVTPENILHTTFPVDHFLQHLPHRDPAFMEVMTTAMLDAWTLLLKLTQRAEYHKLSHWSKLEKSCMPATWFDRTRSKPTENLTFDGGCQVCTWEWGKLAPEVPVEEDEYIIDVKARKRTQIASEESEYESGAEASAKRYKADTPNKNEKVKKPIPRRRLHKPSCSSSGSHRGSSGAEWRTDSEPESLQEDDTANDYTGSPSSQSDMGISQRQRLRQPSVDGFELRTDNSEDLTDDNVVPLGTSTQFAAVFDLQEHPATAPLLAQSDHPQYPAAVGQAKQILASSAYYPSSHFQGCYRDSDAVWPFSQSVMAQTLSIQHDTSEYAAPHYGLPIGVPQYNNPYAEDPRLGYHQNLGRMVTCCPTLSRMSESTTSSSYEHFNEFGESFSSDAPTLTTSTSSFGDVEDAWEGVYDLPPVYSELSHNLAYQEPQASGFSSCGKSPTPYTQRMHAPGLPVKSRSSPAVPSMSLGRAIGIPRADFVRVPTGNSYPSSKALFDDPADYLPDWNPCEQLGTAATGINGDLSEPTYDLSNHSYLMSDDINHDDGWHTAGYTANDNTHSTEGILADCGDAGEDYGDLKTPPLLEDI